MPGSPTISVELVFTLALSMNLLGAPASRRPVGSRKPELAGETPAPPGTVSLNRSSRRKSALTSIPLKNHPVLIVQELDINGVGRTIRRKLHCGLKITVAESLTLAPLPMTLEEACCPDVLKRLEIVNFESLVVGQL